MSKPTGFGAAFSLQPSAVIYYGSIFSQFQMGRTVDLLCSVASKTEVSVPNLRKALNSILADACKHQGTFDTSMLSVEPVTVEYGCDGEKCALTVSFTFDEKFQDSFRSLAKDISDLKSKNALVKNLHELTGVATEIVLSAHHSSRRAEILCLLSASPSNEQPTPGTVRFCEIIGPPPESVPLNDYTELGDVEYAKQADSPSNEAAQAATLNAKKILEAATSESAKAEAKLSHEMDRMIEKGTTPEDVIEALSKSLSVDQMAETIKRNLTLEEIGDLLVKTDPEKIASMLTEQLSEEELNKMVAETLTSEMKAKVFAQTDPMRSAEILKKTMSADEVSQVISEGMSKEDKAQVLMVSDPEDSAKLLKKALSPAEMSEILRDSLPEADQAKVLMDSLASGEIASILGENLSAEKQAGLIMAADPEAAGKILKGTLDEKAINELISQSLPDSEKATALATDLTPQEITELVSNNLTLADKARIMAEMNPEKSIELIKRTVKEEDLARVLAEQLTDEEQGKMLAAGLDSDEASELISRGLTKAQKAKLISETKPQLAAKMLQQGATQEEIAEILGESLSDEAKARVMGQAMDPAAVLKVIQDLPVEEKVKALAQAAPEVFASEIQKAIPKEQLQQMIKSLFSDEEAAKAVIQGLPEEEVAKLLKGSMSDQDIAQVVKDGLPAEDLSQMIKAGIPEAELTRIIKAGMKPEAIVESILSGSNEEEIANFLKSSMSDTDFSDALHALPNERLADLIADTLPPEEILQIAQAKMPKNDFINSIGIGNLAKALAKSMDPNTLGSMAASYIKPEDMIQIVSAGLPKDEMAKILVSSVPKENFAALLSEGLPPQEIARSLSEGLPKEQFAKLLMAIPKEEIGKALSKAGFSKDPDKAPPELKPTQKKLDYKQVKSLLSADLTPDEAVSMLSKVLPKAVAESIISGEIPQSDVAKVLSAHLPDPEHATLVSTRLLEQKTKILTTKEAASKEAAKEQDSYRAGAPGSGEDFLSENPSFAKERQILELNFKKRLEIAGKSTEFYLKRGRDLETSLRAAEAEKRVAIQESLKARKQLEKLLAVKEFKEKLSKPAKKQKEETKASAVGKKSTESAPEAKQDPALAKTTQSASPRDLDKALKSPPELNERQQQLAEKSKQATLFFQEKAKNLENELRQAEGEIRRLKEEHTKELFDLSRAENEAPQESEERVDSKDGSESLSASDAPKSKEPRSRTITLPPEKDEKAVKILQSKVVDLETRLRKAENEKEKAVQESKRERLNSEKLAHAAAEANQEKPVHKNTLQQTPDAPDLNDEVLSKEVLEVDQSMDRVVKHVEKIKDSVTEPRARQMVEGLLEEVCSEKAKLNVLSREMNATIRKTEQALKNVEQAYKNKELSISDELRKHRATEEKMKQTVLEMQQRFEKDKSSTSHSDAHETQLRLKFEQSQRQIEVLTKEVDKLNRKSQQSSGQTHNAAAQQRGLAEIQKQVEIANKALLAKKQETDVLRRQVAEKDAKEQEYKKTIVRLQNDLNSVKVTKKAG